MKRFLFLLLACLSVCYAHAKAVYPSLEQIATKLYANYSVREMEVKEKISYQKKRDGWYVAYVVYNDTTNRYVVRKEQLFWSSSLGKYMNLDMFPHGFTASTTQRAAADVARANVYDFDRCQYFGYDGWDEDVIADYAAYSGTNDTLYEGLARAYSNYAAGFTHHSYAFHAAVPSQFTEKERIGYFIEYEKKAIAIYDAMRKRNPDFEVLIGTIYTKYCNEVMFMYDELLYYGREKEAGAYFNEELYDPFMRGIALNLLESCERNGILFTNGDNDTYPLWYLQWIKGIRTDVAVMNTSLMNTGHFLNRYRSGFMNVPPVKMQVPESVYRLEGNFYRAKDKTTQRVSWASFLSTGIYVDNDSGDQVVYFVPGEIVIHNDKPLPDSYDLLSDEDSAVITLSNPYMRQEEMSMLDVLLSAFAESRPVYATMTISMDKSLDDYFFIEGMVKRFIPARQKESNYQLYWCGPVASSSVFQKNISKMLASDSACKDRVNGERWGMVVRISAIHCAEVLLEKDKVATISTLNALYAYLPYPAGKVHPVDVYAVEIYYKAGDLKNGDALGAALLDHIEKQLTGYQYKKLSTEEQSERARGQSALAMALAAFDRYDRPELNARAQKINERFPW